MAFIVDNILVMEVPVRLLFNKLSRKRLASFLVYSLISLSPTTETAQDTALFTDCLKERERLSLLALRYNDSASLNVVPFISLKSQDFRNLRPGAGRISSLLVVQYASSSNAALWACRRAVIFEFVLNEQVIRFTLQRCLMS